MNKAVVGIVLTILTAIIIFGGVNRVAKISSVIVPIMASAYILIAMFVIAKNIAAKAKRIIAIHVIL